MTLRIEPGLLEKIKQDDYPSAFLITDDQIGKIYPFFSNLKQFHVPLGEKSKSLEMARSIWNEMWEEGCDRKTIIIALGGGVITDLAGFVASCYMRGIDYISIPTSLLGMVDASIGGKTGVNLPNGKNIIGSFYPPKEILIDPNVLETLPERQFRSGLAEVIKTAFILDPDFFTFLENNMEKILDREENILISVIRRTIELKLSVVEEDPKDQGRRAILNWGHTFAHAIETATNYNEYEHGEAVAIGMGCEARLSQEMNLLSSDVVSRLDKLIERAGLPSTVPVIDVEELVSHMKRDKKSISKNITCIVAEEIGKAYPEQVSDEQIHKVWSRC